ncbi:hypothetical protein QE400_000609 [Xanthomonas sacchari]|uniref:hypothetical protein n=1 Tax=Xanthomonas sacchari TaxID=56458 RepID=UPI00278551E9|nr:hypothetical protein [Xanthomonas sacchari]MDQ1091196.1 hypothetical protein [Xanthomonas sacchari]
MDFDALAYPDVFDISGSQYKGQRDRKKSEVLIPYTDAPHVQIGDVIIQKTGPNVLRLKVVDLEFLEGGSLGVGTNHPHMLTLNVENLTANSHKLPLSPSSIHIGAISGHQVQVGNQNSQVANISLADFVKQVAANNDPHAKGLLRQLLENSTVSAIVGAGASALLTAIGS